MRGLGAGAGGGGRVGFTASVDGRLVRTGLRFEVEIVCSTVLGPPFEFPAAGNKDVGNGAVVGVDGTFRHAEQDVLARQDAAEDGIFAA